jgi:hypothetical protein
MKRIYVNLTDEQLAGLKARAKRSGAPVAEEIRRAVADSLLLERDLADIAASEPQRVAAIRKLLQKEPELAVHFPGYLPEQKPSAEQQLFSEQKPSA